MFKTIFFTTTILMAVGVLQPVRAQKTKQGTSTTSKADVKFLDDITVTVGPSQDAQANYTTINKPGFSDVQFASKKAMTGTSPHQSLSGNDIESASVIQFKYALLMNMEVEQIQNIALYRLIEEWYGTPYHLGGSTKSGIDCSALMQILFTTLYGTNLPRTAREQYDNSRRISRAELKEGDLVFFNTRGGVSHVGFYLGNNKFVHASSGGVTISDLYEDYWSRHFIGVGRFDTPAMGLTVPQP